MAISIGYRMHLKLALIVLVLKLNSRSSKATALKIHFFIWALKSAKNRLKVRQFVASDFTESLEFWGLEPALSRALDYAVAEQLITIDKGSYVLADKGIVYYQSIQKEIDVLPEEKVFLMAIGMKVSDTRLAKIATWAQQDVEN